MTVLIVGIISLIAGFAIIYSINRRRFSQRNMFGKRGFKSYEHAWTTRYGEGLGKLVGWLLFIAGAFFIFVYWYNG